MTKISCLVEPRDKVQRYIDGVVDSTIPAGRYQRLAVERHLKDLLEGEKRGLHFDEKSAGRAIEFIESYLTHSKGEWADQPFLLAPWEAFILWVIFGWKRKGGTRRYRIAYIEVARKNGKSTLAAGIGLYLTIADKEPGADVYSAATKKDQARIVHGEAIRMVKKSKRLSRFVVTNKNVISVARTDSTYEPLSKDKDTMDGLNVHGAIIDELHAHKDRGVWDVLVTAMGSRRQPLIFTITTAGFDRETVCWEQHDYSEKILDGLLEDDSHFAFIAAIDEDDDWLDETNWHKANPNLEVSVSIEDMREQANKARQTPAYENAFRRLKLCQWTTQESRWLKTDDWAATAYGTTGLEISFDDLAKSVVGLKCCAGLDLASTTDIAALALVFRMDDWYAVLPYFWVPEDRVIERRSERVSYQNWVDRGYLMTTPGNVIDYAFIKEKVLELGKIYRIQEIAYDRWGATELVQSLEDKGYEMVPFGQGYASMSSPTKELLNLVLARKLIHANHPVLKWMAGNLAVTMDSAGNVKPAKDKSTDKIDGMVAMIMGIDRASRHDWNKKSVYADRGFASL